MNEKFLVIKVAQLAVSYPKSEKNRIVGGVLNHFIIFIAYNLFTFCRLRKISSKEKDWRPSNSRDPEDVP
jgi:hypothetical protein